VKTLPYYLLEPGNAVQAGDFFIDAQIGNVAHREPVDPSWCGSDVKDCPKAIYLRPIPTEAPLATAPSHE
jgi:hypothetical protein